jgi:hypothetical protein
MNTVGPTLAEQYMHTFLNDGNQKIGTLCRDPLLSPLPPV